MNKFASYPRSLVIATLVLLVSAAACSDDTPAEATATLTILAGTVEMANASGEFHPATDGADLVAGDTVRTGPDGRAEISCFEGSTTRLDFGPPSTSRSSRSMMTAPPRSPRNKSPATATAG